MYNNNLSWISVGCVFLFFGGFSFVSLSLLSLSLYAAQRQKDLGKRIHTTSKTNVLKENDWNERRCDCTRPHRGYIPALIGHWYSSMRQTVDQTTDGWTRQTEAVGVFFFFNQQKESVLQNKQASGDVECIWRLMTSYIRLSSCFFLEKKMLFQYILETYSNNLSTLYTINLHCL